MATIAADPRFRLARALLSGQCDTGDIDDGGGAAAAVANGGKSSPPSPSSPQDEAIEIFAALLEESRAAFGDASPDAALCQFEYGNALFRVAVRRRPLLPSEEEEGSNEGRRGGDDDDRKKPAAAAAKTKRGDDEGRRRGEVAAAAAMKRSAASGGTAAGDDDDGDDDDDDDDDGDSNRRSLSNKRPKATTDDGEARGEGGGRGEPDGDDRAEIGEGDVDAVDDVDDVDDDDDDDDDDMDLALEMMDASWSILLSHAAASSATTTATTTTTTNDAGGRPDGGGEEEEEERAAVRSWAAGQLPRVLRCIGDLRSHRMEHGDAVDAYVRSMRYREESWDRWKEEEEEEEKRRRRRGVRRRSSRGGDDDGEEGDGDGDSSDSWVGGDGASSLEGLRLRRQLVEAYALVAEELLACPDGEDVVARLPDDDDDDDDGGGEGDGLDSAAAAAAAEGARMPREVVLAKAEDRLDYARGHYDMAREGLEDVLCRYAGLAAAGVVDLGSEKEDIGYLVMTVVGVGNTIDGMDR